MAEPTPEEQKKPFDDAILEKFKETIHHALTEHPELRSVAVVFDYNGSLNDADGIHKGLWMGADGKVIRPEAIFGSINNTVKMMEFMFQSSVATVSGIKDQAQVAMMELNKRRQALAEEDTEGPEDAEPAA